MPPEPAPDMNAIRNALEAEGLDVAAIVQWSNGELDTKEVARLRDFVPRYTDEPDAAKTGGGRS